VKKTFKKATVQAAVWKDTLEGDTLVLESAGPWQCSGKYQVQENILLETTTGLFFRYMLTRCGSYFTEFAYSFEWAKDDIRLLQVVEATKTITVWVAA